MIDHPDRVTGAESTGAAVGESLAHGEELRRLLDEWSGTRQTFANSPTLGERFEAVAAASPERIALTFENTSLTYAHLNARANQLGHFLRAQGVTADTWDRDKAGIHIKRDRIGR